MRIGIDMGGTSVKLGVVDGNNLIRKKMSIDTRLDVPAEDMVSDIAQAVMDLVESSGIALQSIRGVGIGSPGTIDKKTGVILYSNNYNWENVPIVSQMKHELGLAVEIGNDADVAALGEVYAGAAKDYENAVLLTLGTGVGSGVIINKKIFRGALNGGTEIGHIVIHSGGELCTCGRRGCLEAYASATALKRMTIQYAQKDKSSLLNEMCQGDDERIEGYMPFEAAKKGDKTAERLLEEYETNLAIGIANVINIFRPEAVILGGGISEQKDYLTAPVNKMVQQMCFGGTHGEIAPVITSVLGNDAGIIGAACLIE